MYISNLLILLPCLQLVIQTIFFISTQKSVHYNQIKTLISGSEKTILLNGVPIYSMNYQNDFIFNKL